MRWRPEGLDALGSILNCRSGGWHSHLLRTLAGSIDNLGVLCFPDVAQEGLYDIFEGDNA
jgi:hypothetical protein